MGPPALANQPPEATPRREGGRFKRSKGQVEVRRRKEGPELKALNLVPVAMQVDVKPPIMACENRSNGGFCEGVELAPRAFSDGVSLSRLDDLAVRVELAAVKMNPNQMGACTRLSFDGVSHESGERVRGHVSNRGHIPRAVWKVTRQEGSPVGGG